MLGACNADTSAEPIRLNLKKWTIVNTMGLRIAIVGWITPDTPSLTGSVGKVTFKPVVESVRQCIKDLKRSKEGRKVDLIVGLSHTGYDVSRAGQGKAGGCPAVQRQLDCLDSCWCRCKVISSHRFTPAAITQCVPSTETSVVN